MPVVPQAQRQVATRVIQAAQVDPNAAKLENFGGGASLEKLTAAAGQAIKGIGDLNNEYDNLEADKAIAAATKKKNSLMYGDPDDPDTDGGYFSKQGKDATTEMDTYKTRAQLSFKEIEDTLANDRQKAKFRNALSRIDLEIDGQMKRHAYGEAQKYDQTETAAALKNMQDDAILNYKEMGVMGPDGQPTSKIRESIKNQEEIIKSFAQRQGHAPDSEFTKLKLMEAKTMTHKGVIERMLANDEDMYATEYLAQIKAAGEVDGSSVADLDKLVEAGSLRGNSQRASDAILEQYSSMGPALAAAREIEDPKLRDEVTQRLKVRFSEKSAVQEEQEKRMFDSVADHIEEYKSRDKIPMDKWLSLSASQRSAIDSRIAQLNSGKHVVTDQEKFYNLRLMAATPQTQEKFMKMNLFVEARRHLNDKDFNKLVEIQTGLIKGDANISSQMDGFRSDSQVVSNALAAVGIDKKKKPEVYDQFASKIDSLVQQYKEQNNVKTVPNDVLKKMVDNQLIEGTVPGTGVMGLFKTKKRLFQLEDKEQIEIDVKDLPKDDVAAIKRALEKNKKPVTDANIVDLYRKVRKS